MERREFLRIGVCGAAFASLGGIGFCEALAQEASAGRPNFVFLVADDLAARLGCYGDKAAITPNLDRLAGDGVLFSRAYAQGSVCIPSRTSFMLGLNNRHANCNHFKTHPETMTMGRWFREHGYQTFSVGKIDHDETYTDPKAWDIRVPIKDCKLGASRPALSQMEEDIGPQKRKLGRYSIAEKPEGIDDWARTERMMQFIEKERDSNKPFFAVVGFHSPHDPLYSTKVIYDAFDLSSFKTEWPMPADASPLPEGALLQVPGIDLSEARQREYQRLYYAAVTALDQQVGRIIDQLRSKGLLENTVVVFTGDQGYHLGWRGQWIKHSIDEQVLHVPLIVRMPNSSIKGEKAEGIVELLDLFPTFCDIAGLPIPETLDGKSFLPLLKNPKAEGKPAAFTMMPKMWGNGRTVRDKRWRLVERFDGSSELYDFDSDSFEYYNVIAKPEHADVVKKLHAMLETEFGPMPAPVKNTK